MPVTRNISAAAVLAGAALALLVGCAQADTGDPPTSTTPATALPDPGSRANALLSCMAELGYDGIIAADGTISFPPVPDEQIDSFEQQMNSCSEETPYVPLNESQIKEMYALELQNKSCLEGLGYEVAEPPSEAVYINTYNTADWWFAIASLDALPANEFNEAVEACPPPTFFN